MFKNSVTLLSALLLLTACGSDSNDNSSSGSSSSVGSKDAVVIFYSYPEEACRSSELESSLRGVDGARNITIEVASNSVTCDTYGKREGQTCMTYDYASGSQSCVVGYDIESGYYNKAAKASQPLTEKVDTAAASVL